MKLIHQLLNSGWFRLLAFGFGWIIHDPCPTRASRKGVIQGGRMAVQVPRWGLVLYGVGLACGVIGSVLNCSGSLQIGTWLIGVAITTTVSAALRLGHLKKW